ncbi:MAG TPA: sulfatase [Pirellulaceae bacterium]|nr:sulfatase [Pirellulaceae bacterium]
MRISCFPSFLLSILLFSRVAGAADRPNILFIMADDHNQAAMSCYDDRFHGILKTPNLDRLAGQGMRFNHMTATTAICSPSRASLLTGKLGHLSGFYRNGDTFNGAQQTFPRLLQKAGYETAIVGKWHLRSQPTGFDYYNIMNGHGRFYDCPLKGSSRKWLPGNKGAVVHKGYLTDVITNVSIQWLKHREKNKPFCLMVHHKAPHGPHDPAPRHKTLFNDVTIPEPDTLLDDYAGRVPQQIERELGSSRMLLCRYPQYRQEVAKAREMGREKGTRFMFQIYMKGYLRLVASLDENIGRLLDHLDQSGLSDNTIVIYTSDNGFFNGEHGLFNKMWMYEPSLHLPLLVRWPGSVKPGSVNDDLLSMIDVAPTLLDIAGAPIPRDLQGRSFKPLLAGETPADWRKGVYHEYRADYNVPTSYGIRTKDAKLIRYPNLDRWEFFDLKTDKAEMVNLYGRDDQEDAVSRLKTQLRELRRQYGIKGDTVLQGEPKAKPIAKPAKKKGDNR